MNKLTREETKQLFDGLGITSLADMTDEWTSWILSQLHDPVRLAAWNKLLDIHQAVNPPEYQRLVTFAAQNKGAMLEYQGYERWLYTVGPHSYTGEMSEFHRDFWNWYWPITQSQRAGKPMNLEDLTYFAIWGRGLGKCVAKGTEVLKANGVRVPIEEIVVGDILVSIDQATGRSVPDKVRDIVFTGKKRCVRLKTRTNKSLDLTPEHRLWTFNGWRKVEDIKKGDRVALPRKTYVKPSAVRSDEEVRLLAYMIAEGCTTRVARRYPCITAHSGFTNFDKIIIEDFRYCAESLGFRVSRQGRRVERGAWRISGAQEWLRATGLAGKGAHEKRIPDWVFQLPDQQRWMFLAAMIDTDGWTSKSEGLAICLTSEGLIDDLTYLFLSVGVVSTKRPKKNNSPKNHHQAWTLSVDKEYLSRCATYMPLKLKASRLDEAVVYSRHSLLDAYPRSVVKGLAKGVNRKIRNAGGPHLSTTNPLFSRPKAREVLAICLIPQLVWLEQADVFWDEVVSVENIGALEVYDIEMASRSHNFIANGIVSHNSTNAEWLAIAEGALVGKGFVLYVSGTAEQAEAHVEAIRDRLETEGELQRLYPGMKKPAGKGGFLGEHKQYGWRQDYLMTANGWAVRPVGLDKAIRGWKRGDTRVSLIILDDIDDDDDSPEVILKKERRIAKKILPMGTARTKVVFAQNLIHSNSVLNRMHTRQTDILALRRGDVAIKSFEQIQIEHQQTEKGPRNVIVSGTPTWPHIDMAECQSFLDRSGRDGFLAEYQHDFSGEQHDRVLPEYDDRVTMAHVITWGQFNAKYGLDRIPADWPCDLGLDLGYTSGHISAWSFLTKVPEGYSLSGSIFRYRGCTFAGVGIDDQAVQVRAKLWPNERVDRQFLSHEKLGEQLTLNQKHGWHFRPCNSSKTAGLAQWRHFLQVDRSKPHPFHRDEKDGDTGLWRIGCPAWFDIVASNQFYVRDMKDDTGLKTHRDQAFKWKMRPVEETKSGMTVEQPMKAREDTCDGTRMCLDQFGPVGRPLSPAQRVQQAIPVGYHKSELVQTRPPNEAHLAAEMAEWLAKRALKPSRPPLVDQFGQPV